MKRFQKVLFALTAVVLLGWMGASTASAQVQFFVSASGARPVRFEGLTEATGVVQLSAQSGGTIIGGIAGSQSQIIFDYGTVVLSSGDSSPASAPPLACSGRVGAVVGGVPQTTAQVNALLLKTCVGNTVTLSFLANAVIVPGDGFTISGTRVNANAIGAGNNVNVAVSATVPAAFQATNPITSVIFTVLTVATVQAAPSTTVSVIPTPGGPGSNLLFCTLQPGILAASIQVDVTEKFGQAFLSLAQEQGLGPDGTGVAGTTPTNNFVLRFTMTGIPIGVTVAVASAVAVSSPAIAFGTISGAFTSSSTDQDNDFNVQITGTDNAAGETVRVTFNITVPNLTSFALVEASVPLRVVLRGTTDPPGAPIFSTAASSRQFDGTGFRALACASYLLFPWVAYTADGSLDTGIAISNTSADPTALGTKPQKGDITLYFWTADGSTPPAPLKIATALDGGKSATFVASQIGKAYTGYVIAVCGFQMGHGLAAFLSPKAGVFGASYIALSLFNPRVAGAGVTEAVTQ